MTNRKIYRSTTSHGLLGRMTPWERRTGRYMRAPDHDEGGGGGGDDGQQQQQQQEQQQQQQQDPPPNNDGKSWLDGLNLPDDLRKNPDIGKYADSPEGLIRGMIHLRGLMGAPPEQILRLPKPDDADGNAKLWNTLGRPETPDKYGVEIRDGGAIDKAALDSFLARMHKAGPMTDAMAKEAVDFYEGFAVEQKKAVDDAMAAQRKTWEGELQTKWGAAHDTKLDAIAELVEGYPGAKDFSQFLKDTGFGSDPRYLEFMDWVAGKAGEPGSPDLGGKRTGGGGRGVLTPAEAEAELAAYSNKDSNEYKAINDASHAQHDFYIKRRNELFQLKRGGAAS